MVKDYFRLAYRGARQRKLRSWLTMIGIFVGIAAVVALISLSQGMQTAIAEQFVSLGSDKLVIQSAETGFGPPGTDVSNPLTSKDKNIIEKTNGVDTVVGRLIRSAKIEFNDEVKYDYIISMPNDGTSSEWDLAIEANDYEIEFGRMLKRTDKYKVIVGYNYYDNYFNKPVNVRDKITIFDNKFEVVGILKKSGNPIKDGSIILSESIFREIMDLNDEYDMVAVKVLVEGDLNLVAERIKKELRQQRNVDEGKEDFSVETPGQILETLNTILLIVQGVLIGIAGISLVVGGIGIMNTMYTAVTERTREIGIMKATGAQNNQILLLFLIESGFLGFFGGVIGVSLGFGISKLVEVIAFQVYGSYLIQANFNISLLLGTLLFAFLVGAASGVFPARQAAKLRPVDALRK
ncbi:ABC transporter permease [Candidatus Woesearchaeota archaeon CG10_big_fil_rev_8_21_14_0_10_36_11]|nr:MAG: ABC transporter permease [Candidatus Woesearchaeota archaeon CG10_big_fil_rev_8_21_14_0_10_36_11]